MGKLLRKSQSKRVIAGILAIIMILSSINFTHFVSVEAATEYVTLYFVDNTADQWIKNDDAQMKAIDNTNGHEDYWMTQINDTVWSVEIPSSAYNITFNRYSTDRTTQWNSWSAGGRDENNAYYAEGSEYGYWGYLEETELYFQAGDIVYLDVSEFTSWEESSAMMYVNLSAASKENNNGGDIIIEEADKKLFAPVLLNTEVEEHIYQYIITEEEAGSSVLRFWRGNETTLWNYSKTLTYQEYVQGNNCIKVTEWDEAGEKIFYDWQQVRDIEPLEDIGEAYYKDPEAEDIVTDEETGIIYVKNQLLVSALQGAQKEVFEEIVEEIGAEIVGYIELTNDYQFEFTEDKTMDEINIIIDYLDGFSFVSYVSLNIVEINEEEITTTNDAWYNDGATDEWNEEVPDGDNWGLEALRVPSAWDYSSSFQKVKVGVYDSSTALNK